MESHHLQQRGAPIASERPEPGGSAAWLLGCHANWFHALPLPFVLRSRGGLLAVVLSMVLSAGWLGRAADAPPLMPPKAQRALELEDWPAVLEGLSGDPLTNSIARLSVVRALFETGRLPEELFSWLHQAGPELLSTTDLKEHAGSAHVAEALLELGHLNGAERLAFNSLEMEGESPALLRTLVRLHVIRELPSAADVFLNHLQRFPEHAAWTARMRSALTLGNGAAVDPLLVRIRTNLITRDGAVAGLTTERLLRQALEANPHNRMAFQFLMAHQLLTGRLLYARQTLAGSPQARQGLLPRHYAEAMILHQHLYPGISLGTLAPRIPPERVEAFARFLEAKKAAPATPERLNSVDGEDFRKTYWHYIFFVLPPQTDRLPGPGE